MKLKEGRMRSETVSAFNGPDRNRRHSRRGVPVLRASVGSVANVAPVAIAASVMVVAIVALFSLPQSAQAQSSSEFWPAVKVHIDLRPRVGLKVYAERQNGEELPAPDVKAGVTANFRIKPLFKPLTGDLDPENQYLATLAVGYEYIRKSKSGGGSAIENRLIIESTPRYAPGAGFLFLNRNRMEFRWNNGTYDFRYRFKVTGQHAFKVDRFHFTPYGSGELFWDRNHHSWNENQYAAGVQFPFKRRFMLDTYVLHQNCTTCSQHSLNAFGVTANIYFRRKK
jgi:hypothetical protein